MPVFIAGCGRSGTSYLRTLLDAHPDVFIPSESLFIVDYLKYESCVPMTVLRWLLAAEPQLLCWYRSELPERGSMADTIAGIHARAAEENGSRIWGQKTPRFIRDRSLLDRAFPDIKWILVHRDPRAVVASMKASGQHTSCVPLAVRRWQQDNRSLVEQLRRGCVDPQVLVVDYESLVLRRRETLDTVWRYLGVAPVHPADLEARARPVFFSRSRFPMNTIRAGIRPQPHALNAWRKQLTHQEQEYIEARCGGDMEALGYSREITSNARPPAYRTALLWAQCLGDFRILVRYLWFWPEYPRHVFLRKVVFAVARSGRCLLAWRKKSASRR